MRRLPRTKQLCCCNPCQLPRAQLASPPRPPLAPLAPPAAAPVFSPRTLGLPLPASLATSDALMRALPSSSSHLLRAARHRVQLHHPVRVQQGGHHRYQGYGRRHLSPTKLPIALPRALACRKACGLSPSAPTCAQDWHHADRSGQVAFFSWHVCVTAALSGVVWL